MSSITINFCHTLPSPGMGIPVSVPDKKRRVQARRYAFTINAPEIAISQWRVAADQIKHLTKVSFIKFQPERSPTSDKMHVQGYCELTGPTAPSTVSAIIGQGLVKPHLEVCKGSAQQNYDYVSKTATAVCDEFPDLCVEWGAMGQQGARTDLDDLAAQCAADDVTVQDIADNNPGMFIRYHRGIEALIQLNDKPRPVGLPKKVLFFYGTTGTGKTRAAFEEAGEDAYSWGPEQGKWWNGYNRHKTVIMDEFRGQLEMGYMLRLLDVYPMKIETKGGMRQFVADTVILTGPMHPKELYPSLGNDLHDQFLRRIDEVREFK